MKAEVREMKKKASPEELSPLPRFVANVVFREEKLALLRELDAEVQRRKDAGDRKFNRSELILQLVEASMQACKSRQK